MAALSSRIENLKERLVENEGVMTIAMWEVRDACGFERLREHVVASISETLAVAGIGHVPKNYQWIRARQFAFTYETKSRDASSKRL